VFEIDLRFNAKPGSEVRHELAHGQIGAGGCFSDVMYYANWFMYHLCCLFILQDWDNGDTAVGRGRLTVTKGIHNAPRTAAAGLPNRPFKRLIAFRVASFQRIEVC
jgi:hypothetical protein